MAAVSGEVIELLSSSDEEDDAVFVEYDDVEIIPNPNHQAKEEYTAQQNNSSEILEVDPENHSKKRHAGDENTKEIAASKRGKRDRDVSEYVAIAEPIPMIIDDDHATISSGVMELVSELTDSSRAKTCMECTSSGTPSRRSTVKHIHQNDKWSCGFRNAQMMFTAIIPHLEANHSIFSILPRRLDSITIPNVRKIQHTLEDAWREGYDPRGAKHFCYKIVGTSSKIGALEVSSVMTYLGVDSSVTQFVTCQSSRALLPKFVRSYFWKALGKQGCSFCQGSTIRSHVLAEELLKYAEKDLIIEQPCDCPLLPLYLQWEGHSISIVGIDTDGHFLVLDPMKDGSNLKKNLGTSQNLSAVRMNPTEVEFKDTQVLCCTLGSLTVVEKEERRENTMVPTAAKKDVIRAREMEAS